MPDYEMYYSESHLSFAGVMQLFHERYSESHRGSDALVATKASLLQKTLIFRGDAALS
jgi:hypothetical protein